MHGKGLSGRMGGPKASEGKSLRSNAFDGVGKGSLQSLEADGDQGDSDRGHSGHQEDPPAHRGPVGKAHQPLVHGEPGDWYGYEDGHRDQRKKVFCNEHDDAGYGGAEHFPDPDFPGALLGH